MLVCLPVVVCVSCSKESTKEITAAGCPTALSTWTAASATRFLADDPDEQMLTSTADLAGRSAVAKGHSLVEQLLLKTSLHSYE